MKIFLTLPYPPSINSMYRTVNNRMLISARGRQYKLDCAVLAKTQKAKKLTGDLKLTLNAYRPRKIGDLDNLFKAVQDSLQGICFENDSQIVAIAAERFDDKNNPRVEVQIENVS